MPLEAIVILLIAGSITLVALTLLVLRTFYWEEERTRW